MRKGMVVIATILAMFTFVSTASATYYACKVTVINPKEAGEIAIQVVPGASETRFTGTAKVNLPEGSMQAKMLAVILTAVSLGYEVSLNTAAVPSSTTQAITAVSLNIP